MTKALFIFGISILISFVFTQEILKKQTILDSFLESEKKLSNAYSSELKYYNLKPNLIEDILDEEPYSINSNEIIKSLADSLEVKMEPNLPNLTLAYLVISSLPLRKSELPSYDQKLLIENVEKYSQDSVLISLCLFNDYKSKMDISIFEDGKALSFNEAKDHPDISVLTMEIVNPVTGVTNRIYTK